MIFQKLIKNSGVLGLLLVVAACSAPPPYVHVHQEFNRESDVYLHGIASRDDVEICYSKNGTTPQQVTALAKAECARISKVAIFREQSLQVCPLLTPVAAIYDCVENATNMNLNSIYN